MKKSDDITYYGESGIILPPLGQEIMNNGLYKQIDGELIKLKLEDVEDKQTYQFRYDGDCFVLND